MKEKKKKTRHDLFSYSIFYTIEVKEGAVIDVKMFSSLLYGLEFWYCVNENVYSKTTNRK